MKTATLRTDGGSRSNPGPAGIGFVLVIDGEQVYRGGAYIGETTNNVAEYSALLWGLDNAKAAGVTTVDIESDSELLVNQLKGIYKVKNEGLKPLFAQVRDRLAGFGGYSIKHIYREHNSEADALVNEALDRRAAVGNYLRPPSLKQSLFDLASAPAVAEQREARGEVAEVQGRHATHPHEGAGTYRAAQEQAVALEREVREEREAALRQQQEAAAARKAAPGIYELTVKDHFDAAHALRGYDGPCRHLHGHTWDVEVSVEGTELDEVGILYDFKDLKARLHAILEAFDHKYLNDLPTFKQMNSTAENLARIVYERLDEQLPSHVRLTEVCVWESPIARMRYHK